MYGYSPAFIPPIAPAQPQKAGPVLGGDNGSAYVVPIALLGTSSRTNPSGGEEFLGSLRVSLLPLVVLLGYGTCGPVLVRGALLSDLVWKRDRFYSVCSILGETNN